jgi:hypothetical protein
MKTPKIIYTFVTLAMLSIMLLSMYSPANAGGILGDIVNAVVPGAGTKLDDLHRQVKDAVPPYKAIEEAGSKTVNEAFVQSGAPALQELIARSRDDALRAGVQPIPPDIKRNLSGFVPTNILDMVRYRVKGGGDLTLQVNSIRYGEANAITLDYVVVFADEDGAQFNPTLWAHELRHVRQYQDWGLKDFAIRYLRDYRGVESQAYEEETRYAAWVAMNNVRNSTPINRPVYRFSTASNSDLCSTAVGSCQVNGSAQVGTPCWCNSPMGAATGSLMPTAMSGNMNPPPTTQPPPIAPPPPPVPMANACTTQFGSCAMGVAMAVGSQCTCFMPQGNFPGIAQQRNMNNMCASQAGMCPMGMPMASGDACYCQTPMGPAPGQVP